MAKRLFAGFMLFSTTIVILLLCVAIAQEGEKARTRDAISSTINNNDNQKVAYLTFDDGPSKNTKRILKVLDKYKIKATFFVVSNLINEEYGKLISDMARDGHSIGIHSYSHNYEDIYSSKKDFFADFNKAEKQLSKYVKKDIRICRFPGGSCNCFMGAYKDEICSELEKSKYRYYDWNVSGDDSLNDPSVDTIIGNVTKDFRNFDKPIILLHDGVKNENTVYALTGIIENLKMSGYSFDVLK